MTRIVLDTNCLLAILPSRSPYHSVWINLLNERLQLCVSNEILLVLHQIGFPKVRLMKLQDFVALYSSM